MNKALSAIALNFGHNKNYFGVMKITNADKFEYIESLVPDNFEKSYVQYIEENRQVKKDMKKVYDLLEKSKKIHKFSEYLVEIGMSKNPNSFSTSVSGVLYGKHDGFSHHVVFIKYKTMLEIFPAFKELCIDNDCDELPPFKPKPKSEKKPKEKPKKNPEHNRRTTDKNPKYNRRSTDRLPEHNRHSTDKQ